MTFDDFFTSTERNNGFTAPSRVRELIDVLQNEKDSDVKIVADSTRQWSAVASAIAATDNKDCLEIFIQLDGLNFLDKWLKEAQRFSKNTSDSFLEESITQLLHALKKLPADHEKLVASEIWATIEDLFVHNSSKVQDKARELHQIWKKNAGSDAPLADVGKIGALSIHEVGSTESIERGLIRSEGPASLSREGPVQQKNQESAGDDPLQVTSSVTANSLNKSSEPPGGDEILSDQVGSPSSANCAIKPPASNSIATTSVESCHPAVSNQDAPDFAADCHQAELPSSINQTTKTGDSADKDNSPEEFNKSQDKPLSSCSDTTDAMKSENKSTEPLLSNTLDKNSWGVGSLYINSKETNTEGKTAMVDNGYLNQSRSSNTFSATAGGDYMHQMLRRSSSNEKTLKNPIDLGRLLSRTDDVVNVNRHLKNGDSDLGSNYSFAKKETGRGSHRIAISSDELDYGIIDPLDFARQVANEVEREVVDYKEHSCSSSEKGLGGNVQKLQNPDTLSSKQPCGSEGSVKDVGNNSVSSGEESSPMQEDSATSSETLDAEQANVSPDVGSSQITEAAQIEVQVEKEVGNFDLNMDFCSEENDHPAIQFSAPVSVVAASRATAAPVQPPAPLHFEGNLGWKGSAATSAFRPAPLRRAVESEKEFSVGGSSSSSKQRQVCLDFDLNVAESVEGESVVATNTRKYDLGLDLNNASEDLGPSELQISQFFPRGNGHQSGTHFCSSSSTQLSLRNFDLNGQPSFLNDSSERSYLSKLSQNQNHPGGIRSDDSVISIMGTRVQVKGKDIVSETQPLLNGRTSELGFDLNLGRSGNFLGMGSMVPYTHSPFYGYNNTGPNPGPVPGHASPLPFPSTLYGSGGSIPYMVDNRGTHVIPQLGGSVPAHPQAFTQQPFLINMANSTPSNGVGPSRSTFDLNSGMMVESGSGSGSGDPPVGFRQFLSSGHVRSIEEQMRSNGHAHAQPTISSVGGKRKEPENGWENYPVRHYNTPPWK